MELSINVINHIIRKWGAISHNFMRLFGPYIPQSQKSVGTRCGTLDGPRGDTRSGTWGQGWTGQGFFFLRAGKGQNLWGRGGVGRDKARVKIFGARRGKGQNLWGGAGQNLRISADLDNLLKEEEP